MPLRQDVFKSPNRFYRANNLDRWGREILLQLANNRLYYCIFVIQKVKIMPSKPDLPGHLLWEYDLETFSYDGSYKIVIERVLQLGNLQEWREILRYYGERKVFETIEWSAQLDRRGKDFSRFFLKSDFLHAS